MASLVSLFAFGARAAPLEAYGRLPYIEAGAISQDGEKLALIITEGEVRKVAIEDLATGKRQTLNVGDTKLRDLEWAGPNHLLITMSTAEAPDYLIAPEGEWYYTFDYNLTDGKLRQLLRDNRAGASMVASAPMVRTIDGRVRVFVKGYAFVDNTGALSTYEIDLDRFRSNLLAIGSVHTVGWAIGVDGAPVAQAAYDDDVWTLLLKAKTGWAPQEAVDAQIEAPALLGLGRTPDSLLVAEAADGPYVYKELNIADGSFNDFDIDDVDQAPIVDPASGLLIGFRRLVGDEEQIRLFDPKQQTAWDLIGKIYGGQRVSMISRTNDATRFLVLVDSPTEGPAYAYVDLKAKQARWLGALYQGLQPADIGPVRPIAYKAADGLELTGYLTLPNGADPKALPLIVLPHGGPASRDRPGFDWWAQALASRGYAVLQVNYRGSDGFGWDFMEKGFGEWGRKMQTDLSDGVRYLAGEGMIDPKRVCIVGASYGGYAALAGATLDSGVYRCAASVGGVADLKEKLRWTRWQRSKTTLRYWQRFMGLDGARDPDLKAISPIDNVDKVEIPVLLVHGRDDTVVSIQQSLNMRRALEAKGKTVEFVELKGEDHWLSRGDTRLQMLTSVAAFVEKYNPPH